MERSEAIASMKNYWQFIRAQALAFWLTVGAILVASGLNWYVWQTIGEHQLVPAVNLWILYVLVLTNLSLVFWLLPRERFASLLLLGATLVGELLTLVFLLQV